MKIEVIDQTSSGMSLINTSHGNETLTWDASAYSRTSDRTTATDISRMFDEINAFWATLPKDTLNKIWQVYVKIKQVMDRHSDASQIRLNLQDLVAELYQYMPLNDLKHWVLFKSNIRIPSSIKESLDVNDPPEGTYLRADYQDLVSLSLALRPMVPIWGEYIGASKRESGSQYKEYMALKLLLKSSLINSEPMERLNRYIVDRITHPSQPMTSTTLVLSGLSTSELPDYVMGLAVVRRLAVTEINAPEDGSSIISNLYQYVVNTMRSLDRKMGAKFGGKISEKSQTAAKGDDNNNASLVENYKVKQVVSDGDLVILSVYSEEAMTMAQVVDPTVDPAKVTACLQYVNALEQSQIYPCSIVLTQWTMAPCLSARGIPLLMKPALLRALAVTQALLWHWEFYDLAALATATPLEMGQDMVHGGLESRGRIPKELMDDLVERWPHYQRGRGKSTSVRQTNVTSIAIDAFCDLLSRHDWVLNAPPELIEKSSRIATSRRMTVPAEIRTYLAKLHLKFASERG